MKLTVKKDAVEKVQCDVIIIGMFEACQNDFVSKIDGLLGKEISRIIKNKEFSGKEGELRFISTLGKLPVRTVLLAGLGKDAGFNLEKLRRAAANSFKAARESGAKIVATTLHLLGDKSIFDRSLALCEGILLGNYRFLQFKAVDNIRSVDEVIVAGGDAEIAKAVEKASILCEAETHVRDLVNMPPNIVTPGYMAWEAEKLKKLGVNVTVYDRKKLEKLGFNSMLAVAGGSSKEPYFVVMEYGKGKDIYACVGKGITFDSGGLDLKLPKAMEDMKMDMAGAATVVGIMEAVSLLKLPVHLVCAFPACENMPSGSSYRPGDIITGYNGKKIEMMNSDAEGRMVLSDAMAYIEEKFKPAVMVDFATLTGACITALGYWATGMFSVHDGLCGEFVKAGEYTYERVWRLPLWEEYRENMKSDIADVRNIGKGIDSGAIEGAVFLQHFVENVNWAHFDIAGTAWRNEEKHYFSKGGTGSGVRMYVKWIEDRINSAD